MLVLVHQKSDYIIYGGLTILAGSASNIFNLLRVHKYVTLKPVGKYNFRRHFKAVIIFFAMSCATTVYTNLDKVMLGFMTSDQDVGYYHAAVRIKDILVSIVTSLGAVLLPRASYYVEHGMLDEFYRITKKAINFVWLFATSTMVFFILFAKEGVFFLSGSAYADAILPMQIIMPTLLFIGLTNVMGIQMLIPLGKERIVLYSEIAGMIVDLILNAILIPRFAAAGAAIGTLAAEAMVFAVQITALRKETRAAYNSVHYVHIVIALIISSAGALMCKNLVDNNFLTLCISGAVFYAAYGIVLLLFKETLVVEILRQVIGFASVALHKVMQR